MQILAGGIYLDILWSHVYVDFVMGIDEFAVLFWLILEIEINLSIEEESLFQMARELSMQQKMYRLALTPGLLEWQWILD